MARMHKWLALSALALTLTGCVSEEKYTAMKLRADQLAQQAGQAESDAQASRARADTLQSQLQGVDESGKLSDGLRTNLTTQVSDLKSQLAALQAKYESAMSSDPRVITVNGATALPAAFSSALSEFAAQNPDIVDFDAARGIVKFKSDVTFTSGSTELSAKAIDAIGRFSQILNTAGANNYELMVAGHTDNQRVTREATKDQGNYDNWYLSVHRAIAVGYELVKDGVGKNRLGVAGYADQRPIASNSTDAGRSQNRRVEILILPNPARGGFASSGGNTGAIPAAHRTSPAPRKLDKDSTSTARELTK